MKVLIAGLAAVVVAQTATDQSKQDRRQEPRRMSDGPRLKVTDDASDTGLSDTLLVSADGRLDYSSESNATARERSEIGRYRTTLDSGELSLLWSLVATPAFGAMVDHFGKVTVGDPTRRLLFTNAQERVEKVVAPSLPKPKGFDRIEVEIARLVERARKAPERVLAVDVTWPKAPIQRGAKHPVLVTFTNRGTRPLEFVSPFARNGLGEPVLVLRAERTDVPLLAMRSHHIVMQPIGRVDLKSAKPAVDTAKATVALPPGGTQGFELALPVDWAPGAYQATIIWSDPTGSFPEHRLRGELFSTGAALAVSGPSKPGDEGPPPPAGQGDE